MPAKQLDEEALFHAARRIPSPEARSLFIEQACGGDAGLAERVRSLLEAYEGESDVGEPRSVQTADFEPITERPGSRIGPYRLMEQIGEGGFGLVFVAEQQEPVRRKVALKVIKPGMDSKSVIARFEAERQAIALMDHPNIARVLDAGATDSGRPYFVMELVRGIPITEYCDKNQLAPKERLELFISVCQAVQHAHQKGIIHRDIKPSNVLVTSHDGKPVAKVIDFGVAKAVTQQLTERTIYTQFAQMIGTPLYMSPEQAEMSGLDIDTRTDIYSLGVLLYELLTGSTPLQKKRFAAAAYDEIRRMIREEEPQKPSTRLSQSGDSLPSLAAQRKMEPAKLSKLMRGDLDWITMKALEKDRTRRYETANGLARDIERYLHDEPVEACPPSASYRARKLIRRHKKSIAIASGFAALLLLGIVAAGALAISASRAEAMARAERDAAEHARMEAAVARDRAEAAGQAEVEQRKRAEAERDGKDQALTRAEGNRLMAESSSVLPKNPGLALILAHEAAKRHPGRLANNSMLAALDACHEERTLFGHNAPVLSATFSSDGRRICSVSANQSDSNVCIWDAVAGKLERRLIPFCHHTADSKLSPDGRIVATTYVGYTSFHPRQAGRTLKIGDDFVYLWDVATGKPLFLLRGHNNRVTSADFSPDSRLLVTASWDHTARVWDIATGKELHMLLMPASLCTARFSPDGRQVLTVSAASNYSSFGPGNERPEHFDVPAPAEIKPFDWNSYGSYGWSSGSVYSDGVVNSQTLACLWDVSNGKKVGEFKQQPGVQNPYLRATNGWFSPDGRWVALRDRDTNVQILDVATQSLTAKISAPSIGPIALSPDSKSIAVSVGNAVQLCDSASGAVRITLRGHDQPVTSVAYSPDGRWLATSSEDKSCRIWDAATGVEATSFKGHELAVKSVRFSPDGSRVVTASEDQTVRVWQIRPPREFARPFEGHSGPVNDLAFSPDGKHLVTASKDASGVIWDVATAKQVKVLKGHADLENSPVRKQILGSVNKVAFSPDGKRIVTAGDDTRARIQNKVLGFRTGVQQLPFTPVRFWDSTTGKELSGPMGHESGVDFVQFSAKGERLLTIESGLQNIATYDSANGFSIGSSSTHSRLYRAARVWNAVTGEALAMVRLNDASLESAALSSDGERIITSHYISSTDCPVCVWSATTGAELWRMKRESDGGAWHAVFGPDGQRVYAFRLDCSRCFDAATGKELARCNEKLEAINSSARFPRFSPDGRQFVTLNYDRACISDSNTLKPLAVLAGHERVIRTAAFSPNGKLIVTASDDETARVWDAKTGEEKYTLSGHHGPVHRAVFSPDGQSVATASEDGTARIWPIDPTLIANARKPRELTAAEKKRFGIEPAK